MSDNTWSHHLARKLLRPFVGTRLVPNHITTLRLLTGLTAISLFAIGTPAANAWGGAIFILSAFFDRADGEFARMTGKHSIWGHYYDLITDGMVTALLFMAIAIGGFDQFGWYGIIMGIVAGGATVVIYWLLPRLESMEGGALPPAGGFDLDDTLYLVGPIAWFGLLVPFLVLASLCTPVFAIWLSWRYRNLCMQQDTNTSLPE